MSKRKKNTLLNTLFIGALIGVLSKIFLLIFRGRLKSKLEDLLTKRAVSKNKKLQQAAKDLDWAKNEFAKEFEDEFGEKPDQSVMDYINLH